jgi:CRP-like cAMP-binding protein
MVTLRQYASGEVIVREHDAGETAYIIEQGRVEVTKQLDGESVRLAVLGPGETFGEMSMIDDQPRSATVSAIEDTVLREVHREGFVQCLQSDPEASLNLLKVLFERLRESQGMILELRRACARAAVPPAPSLGASEADMRTVVLLEGQTQRAADALPANPYRIRRFPFRIGRLCRNVLAYNDLKIADSPPLQISEHHVTLFLRDGRLGVLDRGSALGALVNGRRVGGTGGETGPVFFDGPEGALVLGNNQSPYRFKVLVSHQG